jgi:hypothetical protein
MVKRPLAGTNANMVEVSSSVGRRWTFTLPLPPYLPFPVSWLWPT